MNRFVFTLQNTSAKSFFDMIQSLDGNARFEYQGPIAYMECNVPKSVLRRLLDAKEILMQLDDKYWNQQ